MKIPVTREFDKLDPIGMLILRDDIDIPPDARFEFAYTIVEKAADGTPKKIQLKELSLICYPTRKEEKTVETRTQ